jgi:hypothetical protein
MNGIVAVSSAWARVFGSRMDAQFMSRLLIISTLCPRLVGSR